MTATSAQAFRKGMKKGMSIISNPDPKRLRSRRHQTSKTNLVGEAWTLTGTQISLAMSSYRKSK